MIPIATNLLLMNTFTHFWFHYFIVEPTIMPKRTFKLKEYEVILPEEVRPRFSLPLRNRFVQDGRSAKLMCTADGNPTPTLTWFKVS